MMPTKSEREGERRIEMGKDEAAEVLPPKIGPQLFHHKPPKAQLKKAKAASQSSSSSSSSSSPAPPPPSMASASSSSGAATASPQPPPPAAPKKSFVKRMLPFVLAVNFAIGAYVLTRTTKKQSVETEKVQEEAPAPAENKEVVSTEKAPASTQAIHPFPASVRTLPAISEKDQQELFKWILDEKRKVKTKDPLEKKKIDEEKAILKHYIHARSLPSL